MNGVPVERIDYQEPRAPIESSEWFSLKERRLSVNDRAEKNRMIARGEPCFYCKVPLTRATFTWDHYIPRINGGGRGSNLVPCCNSCNNEKGNRRDWYEGCRKGFRTR
jgi:5-methylcytosine-specific restriction endonuclease McrA